MRRVVQLSLFVFVLSVASTANAQSNYANLSGTVFDPQQKAVAGCSVQLTSETTGASRQTVTNDLGQFQITGVLPGDFNLSVQASGFATLNQKIRLEVGQSMTVELSLKLGTLNTVVDVSEDSVNLLKTTDASVGEVVEPTAVSNLPLNGRMLIDLVLTVPGAHESHGAQAGDMSPLYWRPGQRSAVSIAGNRPNANYFLLDGATNTDPTFNTLNFSPSPDSVQEFKVQTGSYTADIGGAGGGQVNIITRSGTNDFHGTAYEFLRNEIFDARTFNEMDESNHLVRNNFGGSFGGPIIRNKSFFFVNYEGLRHTRSQTMVATVPTADEIDGNFEMSGATIYNPFSAHPNPAFDPSKPVSPTNPQIIRDPFPGNVIPQQLIDPKAALFLQKYIPRPNLEMGMMGCGMTMMGAPTVVGAGMDCNNYLDVRNAHHTTDQATARVDHTFNSRDSLFARYSFSSEKGFMPQNLPGFGAFHDNLSQHGTIGWTRVISPTIVNIASVSVSRLAMHRTSENSFTNDIVSELGITGVGFGGEGAYGAPWFNVQGFSGMGDTFVATPMHAWNTILEARDALNWQVGRHSLKIGASYRRFIWPMWGFFQNRGYYQFTNGFTTQTATNDGTGSALASFLLGLPAVKQRQAGIPQMQLRQWYADAFVHDSFQLTRNTTVQIGLRYEYMSPLVDIRYTNTNLTFQDGVPAVFIGGQQGFPEGLNYANKVRFAPRFGLSHNLHKHGLVLHAAFGIFFTPVDMNTWCNQRHNVPYVFPETQQSDNFIPAPGIVATHFNFAPAVLGVTTVSFAAFEADAPPQYIEQWSGSVEKSLGAETTLELGYLGSHGLHLQRSHLINNAPAGPGAIGPRRPFKTLSFLPGMVLPMDIAIASTTFPVSGINLLENSAQSWYHAGYVNVRRRFSRGWTFLANYTFARNLSDAPDFRSPMFESAAPQDNSNLQLEKGLACDVRHRFALSMVYDIPSLGTSGLAHTVTKNWRLSAIYQAQTGFPLTISVFGDTANAGTLLGENPIRANYTGEPVFGPNTRTADRWFNTAAFSTPAAFRFGNVGRNTVYGPGRKTLDLALQREFAVTEGVKVQIRAEAFNALNHTNLGTPNRFVNTPQFGTITEAATPGREIQLGLRVSF
ncbi:MAG TPA: carboxypeptidase-like regulatory domain-containing protein [Pyrinomonadaceae bacterium]|nr:carboxypeptidase-like regulatory domain-containing protein [Pyrinomonadaceae bacterium]